jgi:hypothetical protein
MKRMSRTRMVVLGASILTLSLLAAGTSSAAVSRGPATRTFSFIGSAKSKTVTLVNTDSLLINARCNAQGEPVIYAFSSSQNADLFGRFYDGLGRLHIVRDSSFVKGNPAELLSATTGDFDATGTVLFETYNARVVTVDYAFDNSTTLAKRDVCTVYGSAIAS